MAYSTINITVDILNTEVALEVEVIWYPCIIDGAIVIEDFYAYHINDDDPKFRSSFERIPYWMHKIIENSNELYMYSELIEELGE